MATLDQVIQILNSSKKVPAITESTSVSAPTDKFVFWNFSTNQLESITYENLFNTANKPVERKYDDIDAMLADQGNQTAGFLQRVADGRSAEEISNGDDPYVSYFEKRETSTASLTDYIRMTSTQVAVIEAGQGTETEDCGTVIPLDTIYGHNCNYSSPNTSTAYTVDNQNIINAYARVKINAPSEPSVSGATQQGGIAFQADTDLILLVQNLGDAGLTYSFHSLGISTGEADTLQTVTERGATTDQDITFEGTVTVGDGSYSVIYLDDGTGSFIDADGSNVTISGQNNGVNLVGSNVTKNSKAITSFGEDWNASTNTPTLANTDTDVKAVEYKVTNASTPTTVNFGGDDIIVQNNDIVANDGSIWYKKVDNNQSLSISNEDITVPSNVYACVGFESNIYYDAIIPCFDNGLATKANVEIVCTKGQAFHDRWALTATSPDVGTETMTINVYNDNNTVIATKDVTLNIVEDSGDTLNANLLMVGDSLTFAGSITNTLRTSLETFSGINPTFYGTQGTDPNAQEGRGGWAFSTFVGTGSPFWSGSAIDISYYRNSVLSSAPVFDIVTIQLGVNDSFDNDVKTSAEITTIMDDAKTLIDAFIADNASGKIIVMLPTLCCNTLDGWGDDYDATRKRNNYKENIFLLRKAIINDFDEGAYNANVIVGQAGLSVDRYFGYPRSSGNPATRLTSDTIERHTNALHPTTGYPQIADGILGQVLTYIEELTPVVNLLTNGDFSSGLTGWTNATGYFTDGGGYADLDGSNPSNATLAQNSILTDSVTYTVTYDLVISAGSIRARCGFSGTGTLRSSSGTYTEDIVCSGNTNFDLLATAGTICQIDNVVVEVA